MKRNILLSYVLAFLYHSWFWLGIWVFYYLRFTNYAGIGIVEAIMITLSIALEVPAGVLADMIGKKKTLFLAFLFCGISGIVFGFTTNFSMLILSVLLVSTGAACYSGTLEALQYDSLKDLRKEKIFDKVIANTNTISLIASAVCGVVGGFLYSILPGLPFIFVGIFQLAGIVVVFFIQEPKHDSVKFTFSSFLKNQIEGFKQLSKTKRIFSHTILLVGCGLFMVIASEMLDYVQGVEIGFQPSQFGIITAGMYICAAIVSQLVPIFHKYFSALSISKLSAMIVGITFLLSPMLGLISGAIVLTIRWSFESVFDGGTSLVINDNVDSQHRATTISTLRLLKNIPYAIVAYLFGIVMENAGALQFGLWLGIALLSFLVITSLIDFSKHTIHH